MNSPSIGMLNSVPRISFGIAFVAGKNRVPRPATGKIAVRTRVGMEPADEVNTLQVLVLAAAVFGVCFALGWMVQRAFIPGLLIGATVAGIYFLIVVHDSDAFLGRAMTSNADQMTSATVTTDAMLRSIATSKASASACGSPTL